MGARVAATIQKAEGSAVHIVETEDGRRIQLWTKPRLNDADDIVGWRWWFSDVVPLACDQEAAVEAGLAMIEGIVAS